MSLGVPALLLSGVMLTPLAVADSTADCGRFFLKKNQKTGVSTCVGGKTRSTSGVGAEVRARLKFVDAAVDDARKLLSRNEITPQDEQRIRGLLDQAKQRGDEIKIRIRALSGDQKAFVQRLVAENRQRIEEQRRATDELVREQQSRSQGLLSAQRGRTQGLLRQQQERSR